MAHELQGAANRGYQSVDLVSGDRPHFDLTTVERVRVRRNVRNRAIQTSVNILNKLVGTLNQQTAIAVRLRRGMGLWAASDIVQGTLGPHGKHFIGNHVDNFFRGLFHDAFWNV